jgi:hypothetical protein
VNLQTVRQQQRHLPRPPREEHYHYDPETGEVEGWPRDGRRFVDVAEKRAEEAEAKAAKLLAELKAAGRDANGD